MTTKKPLTDRDARVVLRVEKHVRIGEKYWEYRYRLKHKLYRDKKEEKEFRRFVNNVRHKGQDFAEAPENDNFSKLFSIE